MPHNTPDNKAVKAVLLDFSPYSARVIIMGFPQSDPNLGPAIV